MDIQQILKQLDGAFAKNTLRAYRSDFNDFNTWCNSQQLTPEHITSEDIAKYIVWMSVGFIVPTIKILELCI